MERDDTAEVMRDAFFELTLCLEAIFLIHKADEDLVEAIMRNMEEIYKNATKDMNQGKGRGSYPAVERFLSRLSGGQGGPQQKPGTKNRI